MHKYKFVFYLILCIIAISLAVYAQDNCLECHGESDFTKTLESGEEKSLFVDNSTYQESIHGGLECVDCHSDAEGDPHPEKLAIVDCSTCHDDVAEMNANGIHGQLLQAGLLRAPTCVSCHGKHDILSSEDENSRSHPLNISTTCGQCHDGEQESYINHISITEPIKKFESGVHGHALADGNEMAATCASCHGSHEILPKSNPKSPIFRFNISNTCGQCHEEETVEYDASIHGVALAAGEFDAPTCTSCHGEHGIQSPSEASSPTNPGHIAEDTCSPCHGLLKLNEKYGLLPDPVASWEGSYHGLASIRGSKIAAKCTSCHGIHNILSQHDPHSTIHPANLTKTCGNCHINVTEAFTRSYVHANPESQADNLSAIIKSIYIYLIVFVIGGMFLHNAIIWFAYVRAKYRALKVQKTVQRFDKAWVAQHVTMFVTFTLLVITGFALKFPEAGWVRLLTSLGLTETVRGLVHRGAAVLMLLAGIFHIYYLLFVRKWRGELKNLLPNINDVWLFFDNMKYHLGITNKKPEFDRYGYIEKAEYWALVWGTVIMAITGFVLWFPTTATFLLPSWIVKVSETIHYYEAWLATLAILIYHMFFAIFHPEDYPINLTGFTGKMTEEEVEERFPAWFKKMTRKTENDETAKKWGIQEGKFDK